MAYLLKKPLIYINKLNTVKIESPSVGVEVEDDGNLGNNNGATGPHRVESGAILQNIIISRTAITFDISNIFSYISSTF